MSVLLTILILLFTGTTAGAEIYRYLSEDGIVFFTNAPSEGNGKIVVREQIAAAQKVKAKAKIYSNLDSFNTIAEEKARQHNMDPELVKAVIKAESNWNAGAVSPKGARGLMQLMPSTALDLGVYNSFDPEQNIDGGTRYLKYLLEKFNGNLTLALAAYNAGPRLVERTRTIPSIPETVSYVKRVIKHYSGRTGGGGITAHSETKNDRILKVVRKDGTILFTNAYQGSQDL